VNHTDWRDGVLSFPPLPLLCLISSSRSFLFFLQKVLCFLFFLPIYGFWSLLASNTPPRLVSWVLRFMVHCHNLLSNNIHALVHGANSPFAMDYLHLRGLLSSIRGFSGAPYCRLPLLLVVFCGFLFFCFVFLLCYLCFSFLVFLCFFFFFFGLFGFLSDLPNLMCVLFWRLLCRNV
jgi:hypothetical protein